MTAPIRMGQFVGAPVRAQAFEGVSVAENSYAAGLHVAAHAHDAPLLSLVRQGSATEEIGTRSRELGAHSLLYTPSYETHAHRFLTPRRWLNIQFSAQWFARVGAGETALPTVPRIVRDGTAIAWAARLGAEIREPDRVSRFAIEGALLLLVADLSRLPTLGERRRPRWLQSVEDAIEAAGAEPPSVIDLAALDAGFSDQSHFTRVFRQTFGETPARYARSMRGR